jgi:hypothetical protein
MVINIVGHDFVADLPALARMELIRAAKYSVDRYATIRVTHPPKNAKVQQARVIKVGYNCIEPDQQGGEHKRNAWYVISKVLGEAEQTEERMQARIDNIRKFLESNGIIVTIERWV